MVIATKPLAIANGEVWQIFQGHVLSVTPYSRPSRRIPGGLTVRFTTLADRVLEAYEAATRLLTVFNN